MAVSEANTFMVRDMPKYWCELCWACLILCGVPWLFVTVIAVCLLIGGLWTGVAWVGGASVLYGGTLFVVAYSEARRHWKRRVRP